MGLLPASVKYAAGAVDVVRRPVAGLVALIYHRVGGHTGVRVDFPTPTFDEQVAGLAATGSVLPLDDEALPVLARHGVPATPCVATAHVEERLGFPDRGRPATWSGLAECVATGLVTIGSHTRRHVLLDRLPAAEVADDLDRPIDLVGDRLGVTAEHFAYPKALQPAPAVEQEVRRRFVSAALAGTRANPAFTDVHRLARTPVQATDGARWFVRRVGFARKVAGGMAFEDDLRQFVDRCRYAGATS